MTGLRIIVYLDDMLVMAQSGIDEAGSLFPVKTLDIYIEKTAQLEQTAPNSLFPLRSLTIQLLQHQFLDGLRRHWQMLELTQICLKDTRLELHQHQQHEPGEFPSAIF